MNSPTILKRCIPVCYLDNGNLLLYKLGSFYSYNLETGIKEFICKHKNIRENVFSRIRLFSRLLRSGVRCGIQVDDKIVLVLINKTIYEIDIKLRTISSGFISSSGSRPLKFSILKGIDGFNEMIVFGEYLNNPHKGPVSVYQRKGKDSWEKIFTFPGGEIEHIHNIIADKFNQCVWIMTGDFENSACLWIARENFKTVEPVLRGSQEYRACVGFPTGQGLLYATDSPYSDNSIRLLKLNSSNEWESKKLTDINGSSIYGARIQNKYIFSTAVEGDGRHTSLFSLYLGRKRGSGIKDNFSYVYYGNMDDGFSQVYKAKKDCLPFVLFQFGVLSFPDGISSGNLLPIYNIATSRHDLSTVLLKVE